MNTLQIKNLEAQADKLQEKLDYLLGWQENTAEGSAKVQLDKEIWSEQKSIKKIRAKIRELKGSGRK